MQNQPTSRQLYAAVLAAIVAGVPVVGFVMLHAAGLVR